MKAWDRGYPKGANSMAASGLVFRSDLVGTGRAISVLFFAFVRNKPPFPEFKASFSATGLLNGGCGQSHISAKHG